MHICVKYIGRVALSGTDCHYSFELLWKWLVFRCCFTMHFAPVCQTCFIWKLLLFFFSLSILSFQWAKVCSSLARSLCFKHFSIQSPLLRIASLLLLSFCRFYSFINVACRIYDDCQLCCPSRHIVRHRACLSTAICICAFVHLCFKIFLYIRKMQ